MEESLEQALARTEQDVETTLKTAMIAVGALKRFRIAVHSGNLKDLQKIIDNANNAISALKEQFKTAIESWDFNEEYLGSPAFTKEIINEAEKKGVRIFQMDDKLFSYPCLIQILPHKERAIKIDKMREKNIRPSFLADHLKKIQSKDPKFNPKAFIEGLFEAYLYSIGSKQNIGKVVLLHKVYELLTILPGLSKEYSLQEFARDIYLLDQSKITTTQKGYIIDFPASTGTRSFSNIIRVIAENGSEKKYYGLSFK
jgi:hypothetical protein